MARRGFTLIELIVVIALIGILATTIFSLVNPGAQLQKASDVQRKNDLNQIKKALESYYNDHGAYPSHVTYEIEGVDWGEPWTPYLDLIPEDPLSTKRYVYWSGGQSFRLYASLDRGDKDPGACNAGAACAGLSGALIPANQCGGTCNYGVTSPNISP